MTLDEAIKARDLAQMALHWHLSLAARCVVESRMPPFEREMILAERARADWYAAHEAIVRSEPPRRVS